MHTVPIGPPTHWAVVNEARIRYTNVEMATTIVAYYMCACMVMALLLDAAVGSGFFVWGRGEKLPTVLISWG